MNANEIYTPQLAAVSEAFENTHHWWLVLTAVQLLSLVLAGGAVYLFYVELRDLGRQPVSSTDKR